MNNTLEEITAYGKNLYDMFLSKNNVKFIICPCSIGDTDIIALFVKKYKQMNDKKEVILVIKEQHEDLIKLFSWINFFVLTNQEMLALRYYICCNQKYNDENILYGHFPPKDLSLSEFYTTKNIPLVYEYKNLLGIPLSTKPDLGNFACISEERKKEISDLYKDAFILFPFAQSYETIQGEFWERIVQYINGKGGGITNIYTNSFNSVIPGTQKCELKISELCYAATQAKLCIGIRSGIFDAIASVEGQSSNIVIFTKMTTENIPDCSSTCVIPSNVHLYFDLRDIKEDLDVTYFSYTKELEDTLISLIFNKIDEYLS